MAGPETSGHFSGGIWWYLDLALVFLWAESELLSLEQRTGEKGVLFSATLYGTKLWHTYWCTRLQGRTWLHTHVHPHTTRHMFVSGWDLV